MTLGLQEIASIAGRHTNLHETACLVLVATAVGTVGEVVEEILGQGDIIDGAGIVVQAVATEATWAVITTGSEVATTFFRSNPYPNLSTLAQLVSSLYFGYQIPRALGYSSSGLLFGGVGLAGTCVSMLRSKH